MLSSKNRIWYANLTSLINCSSFHHAHCNIISSLHPRLQWSSSPWNFIAQFVAKYPTNAPMSLVANPRCHKLYVCKRWWLKYDYLPRKSIGEISVLLPIAMLDEDYCSCLHQSTGCVNDTLDKSPFKLGLEWTTSHRQKKSMHVFTNPCSSVNPRSKRYPWISMNNDCTYNSQRSCVMQQRLRGGHVILDQPERTAAA